MSVYYIEQVMST